MTPEERFHENQGFAKHILNTHFPQSIWDEDLLQEAYIGLWKACLTFEEGKGKFSTYAGVCIQNAILMEFRRRSSRPPTVSWETPIPGQDGLTLGDTLEDPKPCIDPNLYDLERFLQRLNERDRRLVALRLEGFTQKQIAAMVGYRQSYVSRLMSAIEKKYLQQGEV